MQLEIYPGVSLWFDVSALESEPGSAATRPTILVLHGGPGSDSKSAKRDLRSLWRECQCIFVDLRGSGRSTKSEAARWTLQQWSDDLVRFITLLDLRLVTIVGISFGGIVASLVAERCRDRIAGLALLGTYNRFVPSEVHAAFLALGAPSAANALLQLESKRDHESAMEYRRTTNQLFEADLPITLRQHRASTGSDKNLEVYVHFVAGEMFSFDLRPTIARLGAPILLLRGDRDPLVSEHNARESLSLAAATSQLVTIPQAGHLLGLQVPKKVGTALSEFINRVAHD
jgi:pimeloyl-ACP methyl ester carboxylesterase